MSGSTRRAAGRGEGPNPVDVYVGSRVRLRRTMLGMSQEKLGELLGLTFQQVQKYERGTNRVSASRLYDLARVLQVPISHFFEGMPGRVAKASPALSQGLMEEPVVFQREEIDGRQAMELMRAFNRISQTRVRKRLFELTKALAAENDED